MMLTPPRGFGTPTVVVPVPPVPVPPVPEPPVPVPPVPVPPVPVPPVPLPPVPEPVPVLVEVLGLVGGGEVGLVQVEVGAVGEVQVALGEVLYFGVELRVYGCEAGSEF